MPAGGRSEDVATEMARKGEGFTFSFAAIGELP